MMILWIIPPIHVGLERTSRGDSHFYLRVLLHRVSCFIQLKYIVFIEDITNAMSHRDYELSSRTENRTIKKRNEKNNAT